MEPEQCQGALVPAAATKRSGRVMPGQHIVLRDLEGAQRVFHLTEKVKDVKMGKYAAIPVDAVLNLPFGASLRHGEGGEWLRCQRLDAAMAHDQEAAAAETPQETNEHFAQDNTAQALSPQEISVLKDKHSGEDVVAAIASSSATFTSKTKFSKEKYIRKKQRKHLQQVTVLRPTVMELSETYYKQSRQKVCGLRFDYLSSILSQADVHHGGRFFVFDCANGLVTGAMAQQLGGLGRIFRVFVGGCSERGIVELDLGDTGKVISTLPLNVLQSENPWSHEWLRPPPEPAAEAAPEEFARHQARCSKAERRRALVEDFKAVPMDAVVTVAGDDDADLAADALALGLAHLSPGGRLVVYGQNLQPLAARQGHMRASGNWVDVRLTQLFTREFQVLPQRTHPLMAAETNHTEGFLLAATKVVAEEHPDGCRPASVEAGAGRKKRRMGGPRR